MCSLRFYDFYYPLYAAVSHLLVMMAAIISFFLSHLRFTKVSPLAGSKGYMDDRSRGGELVEIIGKVLNTTGPSVSVAGK